MPYELILVEQEDGVTIVTLNRPEVLNAMNHQLNHELHDAVAQANADDEIGCIVITGSGGRAFRLAATYTSSVLTPRSAAMRNGTAALLSDCSGRMNFRLLPNRLSA